MPYIVDNARRMRAKGSPRSVSSHQPRRNLSTDRLVRSIIILYYYYLDYEYHGMY